MAADGIVGRRHRRVARAAGFVARELALWASCYGIYLALRAVVIADEGTAVANALEIVGAERALGIAGEALVQDALSPLAGPLGAYYVLGFAPSVAAALIWLAACRPKLYDELRTKLLAAIGLALLVHAAFPAAPPRLVGELGIVDTVGLGGHDSGSFLGVPFNPYAAMPSMHVGWSLLVALSLRRALRPGLARHLVTLHPVLMAAAVTATGNHYFLDSLAGAAVATVVCGCDAARRRVAFPTADAAGAPARLG